METKDIVGLREQNRNHLLCFVLVIPTGGRGVIRPVFNTHGLLRRPFCAVLSKSKDCNIAYILLLLFCRGATSFVFFLKVAEWLYSKYFS